MNREIQSIFKGFTVNGKQIPVSYMVYKGNETTYITYMETDKGNSYSADNEIQGYITYYDFDVYSKGNYLSVLAAVKTLMKENGWTWQPSRDSPDMYENDTGYYHKTLCFAIEREVNNG